MSLSLEDPIFRSFAFYAALSIIKMFCCTFLTVANRFANGVFPNPEDDELFNGLKKSPRSGVGVEAVERQKRNHQNDLENIIPFVLVGLLYVNVDPSYGAAIWHFRLFFFSRLAHFISYQLHLQPWRGLGFGGGLFVTLSMLWSVISATM